MFQHKPKQMHTTKIQISISIVLHATPTMNVQTKKEKYFNRKSTLKLNVVVGGSGVTL